MNICKGVNGMRRVLCIFLLAALLFPAAAATADPKAYDPLTEDDFVFVYDGQAHCLGDPALPLVEAIRAAEAVEVVEADSCMFTGKDKEFQGETLLIATYPIGPGGADVLETILVVGGDHRTARGIGIGASMGDVIAEYGPEYTLDYDQVTYALGNALTEPVLVFLLDLQTDTVVAFYMMRNTYAV